MKKFEMPEIKVVCFSAEDVITTSGLGADGEYGGTGEDD